MKKSNAFSPLLCAIALAVIAAPIAAQAQVSSRFNERGYKVNTTYTITMFPFGSCRIPDDHKDAYETGLAENRTSPS